MVSLLRNFKNPHCYIPLAIMVCLLIAYKLNINKTERFLVETAAFILNPVDLCIGSPRLFVFVPIRVSHFGRRNTIRSTWGEYHKEVAFAFVLGTKVNIELMTEVVEEYHRYNDIIMGDFHDTYHNLTVKVLLAQRWIIEHCPSVQYVLKADEDIYVNIPRVLQVTAALNESHSILGRYNNALTVNRDNSSKWYVPHELFNRSAYPQYMWGPNYMIRMETLPGLWKQCLKYERHPIEDAMITGVCADELNIPRLEMDGFLVQDFELTSWCLSDVISIADVDDAQLMAYFHRKCLSDCSFPLI